MFEMILASLEPEIQAVYPFSLTQAFSLLILKKPSN